LRLVGAGAKLLRNEIPLQDTVPVKISLPGAAMSKAP